MSITFSSDAVPTKCGSTGRDVPVDLVEVSAQLVVSALAAQISGESATEAQRRQSEFLYTLVHELRNPLAPISSATTMLNHAAVDPSLIPKIKKIIERQVTYISHLLDNLLDLARSEAGKLNLDLCRIDLTEFADEILTTYSPVFARREQTLLRDISDAEIYVYADPVRLTQILNNLLDNAIKYTSRGGVISLSVWTDTLGAQLKIADNGIGIDAEVLPNIFTLYLQDPAANAFDRQGLGIGLTVVHELVLAHGGVIVAHSDGRGRGSEFVLTLPIGADTSLKQGMK